jgi:hypothetical protein
MSTISRSLRRWASALLSGALLIASAACSSSTSPTVTPAFLQFVNASPDAPALTLLVDGTAAYSGVPYPQSGGVYVSVAPGSRELTAGVTETAITVFDTFATLDSALYYTLFAADSLASIQPVLVRDKFAGLAIGKAGVRFIHLSPNLGAVDVTVGPLNTPLASNLAFEGATEFQPVVPGTFSVVVHPAGNESSLVTLNNVSVVAQKFYTVWLGGFANASTGQAPLSLQVITH